MVLSIESQQELAQELADTLYKAGQKLAEERAQRGPKSEQQTVRPKYRDTTEALMNEAKKAFMFYRSVCRTQATGRYENTLKPLLQGRANSQKFGNTPRNESEYYKQIQQSLDMLLDQHQELLQNDHDLLAIFGWALRIAEYYQQYPPHSKSQRHQSNMESQHRQPNTESQPLQQSQQDRIKPPSFSETEQPRQQVDSEQRIVNEFLQRVEAVAPRFASGILPNMAEQVKTLPVSLHLKRQTAQALIAKAERDIDQKKLQEKRWFQKLRSFLDAESQA